MCKAKRWLSIIYVAGGGVRCWLPCSLNCASSPGHHMWFPATRLGSRCRREKGWPKLGRTAPCKSSNIILLRDDWWDGCSVTRQNPLAGLAPREEGWPSNSSCKNSLDIEVVKTSQSGISMSVMASASFLVVPCLCCQQLRGGRLAIVGSFRSWTATCWC